MTSLEQELERLEGRKIQLQSEPKKIDEYTLREVFRTPLKGAFNEMLEDINFSEFFKGKKKVLKCDLATLVSFGLVAGPHELIHAGVNKLMGGINKEIVLNRLYGGDLYHLLYEGIQVKTMIPLIGGYVRPENLEGTASVIAMLTAPYILTPMGIYLLMEGRKRKSLPLSIAGAGFVAAHAGGVIGDFNKVGEQITNTIVEAPFRCTETYKDFKLEQQPFALSLVSFYMGLKMCNFSYRCFKAGVSSLRKMIYKG